MSHCDCHEQAESITEKSVLITLLVINGFMFCAELILGIIQSRPFRERQLTEQPL